MVVPCSRTDPGKGKSDYQGGEDKESKKWKKKKNMELELEHKRSPTPLKNASYFERDG